MSTTDTSLRAATHDLLPNIVVIVGPSGVGKTALCECWSTLYPQYHPTDDLPIILEFLQIDRLVVQAPPDLREQLTALRSQVLYTADVVDSYLAQPVISGPRFCAPVPGTDQMVIADPIVWDEALVRRARSLIPGNRYLCTIARGHDPRYLQQMDLSEAAVYPRALGLFLRTLHPTLAQRVALVHLTAGYGVRAARNEQRQALTGQHVPAIVMRTVFARDVLDLGGMTSFSVGGRVIPAFTIGNHHQHAGVDLALHLTRAAGRAMESFLRSAVEAA